MEILGAVIATLAIYRSGEGHKPVASEDTGWQPGEQRG
jgi:hypothetical protein